MNAPGAVNFSDPEYNKNHASLNKYTNVNLDNAAEYAFFVQYEEGIYVGYKYYETADAEAKAGNYEGYSYDDAVVYPFGYGLSYTTFTQEITSYEADDKNITVEVTVTNYLRGVDYDDPQWDEFMDQFTVEEMAQLVSKGGFGTLAVESVSVPAAASNDGSSSLKTSGLGTEATSETLTGFPSEVVLASIWNKELAHEMGSIVGQEGNLSQVYGWYAPGLNTHRNAFGGRN